MAQAPTATERDIKRAYHNSMRSCHPDFASSRDDEESATEVCVFLNDIYEVRCLVVRLTSAVSMHLIAPAACLSCMPEPYTNADADGQREAGRL